MKLLFGMGLTPHWLYVVAWHEPSRTSQIWGYICTVQLFKHLGVVYRNECKLFAPRLGPGKKGETTVGSLDKVLVNKLRSMMEVCDLDEDLIDGGMDDFMSSWIIRLSIPRDHPLWIQHETAVMSIRLMGVWRDELCLYSQAVPNPQTTKASWKWADRKIDPPAWYGLRDKYTLSMWSPHVLPLLHKVRPYHGMVFMDPYILHQVVLSMVMSESLDIESPNEDERFRGLILASQRYIQHKTAPPPPRTPSTTHLPDYALALMDALRNPITKRNDPRYLHRKDRLLIIRALLTVEVPYNDLAQWLKERADRVYTTGKDKSKLKSNRDPKSNGLDHYYKTHPERCNVNEDGVQKLLFTIDPSRLPSHPRSPCLPTRCAIRARPPPGCT